MDMILRRVRRPDDEVESDVSILKGSIVDVSPHASGSASREFDMHGSLLSPAFVEPHIHLDKALLASTHGFNEEGTLARAIELNRAAKSTYTVETVKKRVERALALYIRLGTLHFRCHVDIDTDIGLIGLRGVLGARERFRDLADVEIVAFPHAATQKRKGSLRLLEEALDAGADMLGGFPDVELSLESGKRHIDEILALAKDRAVRVDMHVDEGTECRYLEYLSSRVIEEDMIGDVSISHECALGSVSPAVAVRLTELLRMAEISVVTCPETNLLMGGRLDQCAPRRGMAPVKRLLASGITVTFGQDNMQDMFCPYGIGDALQVALVGSLATHMTGSAEVRQVYDMVTSLPAKQLKIRNYGVSVGDTANLVSLNVSNVSDAIRGGATRTLVIRHGAVVGGTLATEADIPVAMKGV